MNVIVTAVHVFDLGSARSRETDLLDFYWLGSARSRESDQFDFDLLGSARSRESALFLVLHGHVN